MARRRIGQEDLIAQQEPRAASSLAELAARLDWAEVDRALVGISAAAKGEPGWAASGPLPRPAARHLAPAWGVVCHDVLRHSRRPRRSAPGQSAAW